MNSPIELITGNQNQNSFIGNTSVYNICTPKTTAIFNNPKNLNVSTASNATISRSIFPERVERNYNIETHNLNQRHARECEQINRRFPFLTTDEFHAKKTSSELLAAKLKLDDNIRKLNTLKLNSLNKFENNQSTNSQLNSSTLSIKSLQSNRSQLSEISHEEFERRVIGHGKNMMKKK